MAANKKIFIKDVDKYYGDKRILDNVDLGISSGEFCTVVGPSGCGKSTMLRLILGQEQPTVGSISIKGNPVGYPDPQRGIVYQKYTLYPHLTVLENVLLGMRLKEYKWWLPWPKNQAMTDEAMEYLAKVRLTDAAHKYPHELSGGMQQRVAIAQALVMKPPALLMDEPFGALDPDTREELQLFLLDLWEKENLTILFVTHDLEEACFLGSRLLVLSQYYTDDRGDGEDVNRGGRIVADYELPKTSCSTDVKKNPEFIKLIDEVRNQGFNPAIRQHVKQFNLNHKDSYQTLTSQECADIASEALAAMNGSLVKTAQ